MLRLALAWLLLLSGAGALRGDDFAPRLPELLPDMSRWEVITGELLTTSGAQVSYRFMVNPARPGLYQVMRYRRAPLAGASNEMLVFNEHPGQREPLRCFERAAVGWRELAPRTSEYDQEMANLIQLLMTHRKLRLEQE